MKGEEYGFKSVKTSHTASPFICLLLLGWLSHQDGKSNAIQSQFFLNLFAKIDITISNKVFHDIMHVVAFFIIGLAIYTALNSMTTLKAPSFTLVLLIIPIIALLDEYHQSFIPGRTTSISDFIFDLIGGYSGIIVAISFNKLLNNNSRYITQKK